VRLALALAILAAGCGGGSQGEERPAVKEAPGRNRLARETSPYLLQHADNPVDWYPWGEEALARARAEDKPILVSIGYSSCHWCHVMEHECFEDERIAALMNELFVCVKVDREERPDVDEVYMTAVQLMGVGGGWPLNVFLTPDGRPFFGGTYFPPDDRFGRPGWPTVLRRVAELWRERRGELTEQAAHLVAAIDSTSRFVAAEAVPEARLLEEARRHLAAAFDEVHGGFGEAPKFPPTSSLQLLLRRHRRGGAAEDLRMVDRTLRAMAQGGIRDQLGGGFHRYSTDERWLVPHFEKMLYDNAQLARVYVEAWQVTSDERHAGTARETLDYVLRELTDEQGGFRSATDADSEGREGVYFVWRRVEIEQLLGEDAALFCRAYGVTVDGNFEDVHHPRMPGEQGMNVLHLPVPLEELAVREKLSVQELDARLAANRAVLFRHRQKRVYPALDDKVIASWNGLMIGSLAYAGRALDEPRYVEAAERAASFVLRDMRAEDGSLLRTWRGGQAKIPAFLEDHAFLASAFLDLYEATFDARWLAEARAMAEEMNRLFWDESAAGWRHTAAGGETLVAAVKSPADGSIPGGNGVAAQVMLRLAVLLGDGSAAERAERTLRLFASSMERFPGGTVGLLLALDLLIHEDGEIAFVGPSSDPATRALVRTAHRAFLPGTALALLDPTSPGSGERTIPLLEGKTLVDGRPAAYVCRNYACRAPVTTDEALANALAEL
jgi:uncharacterized protein YyaL (SSP411 family)